LLENPEQLALLRGRMELLPSAIEEVLRYRSPFQWIMRTPREAIEMGGQTLRPGELVLAMVGSANRDEREFEGADQFDITRDSNSHLAFGHGIHFCMGAALSRLEARIALTDLLGRLEGLELVNPGAWEPRKALHVHGPTRLGVRFVAR
jgi:cytochrome P450